jgi:hypothetical protein
VIYAGRPEDIIWHGIQTDENGVEIAGANTPEGWNAEVPLPFPENQDKEEDYPEYRPPEYEPKFYEYIEKMLAAKFATKNTTQPQLHNTLIQEAFLIKQEAINASKSISQAKQQPKKWWTEEMGG